MRTEPGMTFVTALKPRMEGRVVRALHDFQSFSPIETRGKGHGRGKGGTYKATEYDFSDLRHLQLQIVCPSDLATDVCRIAAKATWTGRKGDGLIFTSDVASFIRIREAGDLTEEDDQ